MKPVKFFWAAPAWQALAEAWLLGLVIVYALSLLAGQVTAFAFNNGMFFLFGTCGLWVVARARIRGGPVVAQAIRELGVAILLSLVMCLGLGLPALTAFDLTSLNVSVECSPVHIVDG